MAYHSSPIYLVEATAFYRVWIDRVKIPVRHKYLIIQILMNLTGYRWTVWAGNGNAPGLALLKRLASIIGPHLLPPDIQDPQCCHKGIPRHRQVSTRS